MTWWWTPSEAPAHSPPAGTPALAHTAGTPPARPTAGCSEGGQDPLDGYLAVWIGLESVGPAFGTRMHEHGPKLSCNICGNQAGINRDKGEAGMEHAIKEVAPELLEGRSLTDLTLMSPTSLHDKRYTHLRADRPATILPQGGLLTHFGLSISPLRYDIALKGPVVS